MWRTDLVALRHVGSSQTRSRTRVPCIGRQIPNHCATREAPVKYFLAIFYSLCFCMNKRMIQLQIFKKFLPVLHCSGLILTSQCFPVTLSQIATLHVLGLPWRTVTLCYVTCIGSTWRALTIANNIFFPGATHAPLGAIHTYCMKARHELASLLPTW